MDIGQGLVFLDFSQMADGGKTPQGNERLHRPKRIQRKWTRDEERRILEYFRDTISKGLIIEKPNVVDYYKKLIEQQKLKHVTPQLIKNKVRNMQTSYKEALKWQAEIGQEIKDLEGETSYHDAFKRRYPLYDEWQEIWGGKLKTLVNSNQTVASDMDISTPYVIATYSVGDYPCESQPNDPIEELSIASSADTQRLEVSGSQEKGEWESREVHSPDVWSDTTGDTSTSRPPSRDSSTYLASPLNRNVRRKRACPGRAWFEKIRDERTKLDENRLALQKEQLAMEKERITLEWRRLEAEMEHRKAELLVRRLESNNLKETRLAEIELEKMKWEAQLQKYRQTQ